VKTHQINLVHAAKTALRRFRELSGLLLIVLVGVAILPAAEPSFESPPFELAASEILPAEVVTGEHHRVVERVVNNGYMNYYEIESEYGTFTVDGTAALSVRISEIGAIAQLVEISRSEAFADAMKTSATRQYRAAKTVIDQPVETVKRLPGSISRLVKRTARQIKDIAEDVDEGYDDYQDKRAGKKAKKAQEEASREVGTMPSEEETGIVEETQEWWDEDGEELAKKGGEAAEKYAKKAVGYTGARRRWAKALGVDPYTDNSVLSRELYRVAQAASVGGLTMRLVPVPKISALGYLGDANALVWTMRPLDLRMRNEKLLYAMGVSEDTVEALYENRNQSPSLITFLVNALVALDGVEGRAGCVQRVTEVESRTEAEYFLRAVNFLAAYHGQRASLVRLVDAEVYPWGLSRTGSLVLAAPMDRMYWTEDLAVIVENRLPALIEKTGAEDVEAWIEGTASDLALRELVRSGFKVRTRAFSGLTVTLAETDP
jgi:hypothetical protein